VNGDGGEGRGREEKSAGWHGDVARGWWVNDGESREKRFAFSWG
jgi:hypothetical protein